ncbi:MAG: endonuclease/exonuclease/phosphatase family protein, partial [Sphingomonadales bacterium]|nr:endonuclease/exonuclease/phosphatase family protein [Sphingomonadales bacterium]
VDALDPDVLVAQECEDPAYSAAAYRDWADNYCWIGYGKSKGIGVFARRGLSIERLDWHDAGYQLFLPVRIAGKFNILAVWTQSTKPASMAYIGQFWHYLQLHKSKLDHSTIICGDFNSNQIWDRPRRAWNHSDCVRELGDLGFFSAYHRHMNEPHGAESDPTFYLYRDVKRPFHMDYIFAHEQRLNLDANCFKVGSPDDWLTFSDHMPLIIDL